MKKQISYFTWNAFLLISIIMGNTLDIAFPVTIIGVLAGIELACWGIVLMAITNKTVRDNICEKDKFRWYKVVTESAMVVIAMYCGYKKIACAWAMIAMLYFSIIAMAHGLKDSETKEE